MRQGLELLIKGVFFVSQCKLGVTKTTTTSHPYSFPTSLSPAEDSTQQRGVEALRRGEASLHLPDRHLVLGGGAEQREATRDRTEDLGRVGHGSHTQTILTEGQDRQGRPVQLGRDGNYRWRDEGGQKDTCFQPYALFVSDKKVQQQQKLDA